MPEDLSFWAKDRVFEVERRQGLSGRGRRTLLGLAEGEESEEPGPDSRSLLGLEGLSVRAERARKTADAAALSEGHATADSETPASPVTPDEEIFHLDRSGERAFPIERAILFSLAAHVLAFLLILVSPRWSAGDPRKGLLGAFMPSEKTAEERIPVVFRAAPGPTRDNSKKSSSLSDVTRRAGGGDPTRARSEAPFVPVRPGKEGLAEGSRSRPASPSPPAAREGERVAEKSAATAPGEKQTGGPDALRVPPPGPASAGGDGSRLSDLNRAIRDAARGVERPGEQGAGFPNPEGGFVDSGPISFDTKWYDWGPYAAEMVRRIKLHWEIPELARFGWKGKLTIRFFIRGDGSVEGATILSRSGIPPFDFAALQAIVKSNPFRPLPHDLGSDREGVTVTFFYNIRPGKDGEGEGSR